ncbi:MAG: peptidoglycan-binding protein [Hyphomicrobiaceae bacterium]
MFRVVCCFALCACVLAPATTAQTSQDVLLVQTKLAEEGYAPGGVDGRLGVKTVQAIKAYQRDWLMNETGAITPELIMMLTRQHARTKSQWYRVEGKNCTIWNPYPQAQEMVTWSGSCQDGKTSGQGDRTWTHVANSIRVFDGRYSGQDASGRRNGKGVFTTARGYRYEGRWKDGELSGQGVLTWPDGSKYKGGFKDGRPEGVGVFAAVSGGRYEGEFRNGKFHGNGISIFEDGDRYEGGYKDGKRHGTGAYSWSNGNKYVGEYKEDEQHGRGIFTWASGKWKGDRYEGDWRFGKRHGRGIYTWSNGKWKGNRFEGYWRNGRRHGPGVYTWANGNHQEGEYDNGRQIGRGSLVTASDEQ